MAKRLASQVAGGTMPNTASARILLSVLVTAALLVAGCTDRNGEAERVGVDRLVEAAGLVAVADPIDVYPESRDDWVGHADDSCDRERPDECDTVRFAAVFREVPDQVVASVVDEMETAGFTAETRTIGDRPARVVISADDGEVTLLVYVEPEGGSTYVDVLAHPTD